MWQFFSRISLKCATLSFVLGSQLNSSCIDLFLLCIHIVEKFLLHIWEVLMFTMKLRKLLTPEIFQECLSCCWRTNEIRDGWTATCNIWQLLWLVVFSSSLITILIGWERKQNINFPEIILSVRSLLSFIVKWHGTPAGQDLKQCPPLPPHPHLKNSKPSSCLSVWSATHDSLSFRAVQHPQHKSLYPPIPHHPPTSELHSSVNLK